LLLEFLYLSALVWIMTFVAIVFFPFALHPIFIDVRHFVKDDGREVKRRMVFYFLPVLQSDVSAVASGLLG
jgi:hypothetical protein